MLLLNTSEKGGTRKVVILHGMGGIDKTQIALEYAHLHQKHYTSIFWADAKNQETLHHSGKQIIKTLIAHYATKYQSSPNYSRIATDLGMPGKIDGSGELVQSATDLAWETVQNWLSKEGNEKWLLLVDNNDDLKSFDLGEYLPTCEQGNIIITSRIREACLRAGGTPIEVPQIGKDAGLQLLLKSANKRVQDLSKAGKLSTFF